MRHPTYHRIDIAGHEMFYREAGEPTKPTLLLLHGFPSASHMFRDLIPLLADRFHLVAPDIPGFGQSEAPSRGNFAYTFDNLAGLIQRFIEVLGIEQFALYVFDIGAPIGFRIAMKYPDRVKAIISQNGNAYEGGLSDVWNPIRRYWSDPTTANRDALREIMKSPAIRWQYEHGVSDLSKVSPDGYSLDAFYMTRPDAEEIQLDIALDYANNVAMYPKFQAYFRQYQPRLLAIWGDKDPFFLRVGAEAFKRDLPNAEVRFLDTGHFALETHSSEIAAAIVDFLT
ncbi:pimeloyl-ACP methyl ester carboxylesterase [Pararhizobium capsulatum DSM 1112]|uniref:Pimeloyl-ACP methyl ester carboxylesterase n=1 Tax=Pararhizobium capsulatum DSM 1112 TaxID=1121113 RepID=A0ABU0BV14_9HYPH|nr:alpha/beta hydrolase [Pararhizobium capsulatum]MDQ0322090.1 pimeloyl-ACP methyl ester carboxylesterase [Pararhizobium capsulatum DSM 1112]